MSQQTAARAEQSRTSLDLYSVTRGYRLVSWFAGRSENPWIDRWTGRLALRLAQLCGKRPNAAWPGPIYSKTGLGVPLLSWFVVPVANAGPEAFVVALDTALHQDASAGTSPELADLIRRFLDAQAARTRHGLAQPPVHLLEARRRTRVLLIDERKYSNGIEAVAMRRQHDAFERMIKAAQRAHPEAEFWLARSEDEGSGYWLSSRTTVGLPPGIERAPENCAPSAMLQHVDHVYTISASEGMYALLAGIQVHVFGAPYYAGWGLTNDDRALPGRTAQPTPAALFDIVFMRFARYLNPTTHSPGTLDTLLDSLELQRAVRHRFSDLRQVVGIRFQLWKRPFATPYLTAGTGSLRWTQKPSGLENGECAALWGARTADELPPHIPHVRIEDGFFHSTGLGSDMIAPCSQVIDRRGLYFDASQPSDLTVILNQADFDDKELARASALREMVVRLGVTKYNLGRRLPGWTAPPERQVVLVPGQVSDDASIRLGTRAISTADALLREVRKRRPDAFIVYKPHPDVLSGNRKGLIDAYSLADIVDTEADLLSLVDVAHEVHTLSSLAGFDALLRGKSVFTYGLPFYAGWGLTHDALAPLPWRERRLSLDMLTAGVLLRYPIYWDWRLRLFTTPEAVVQQLAPQASRPLEPIRGARARPYLKAIRWSRNVLGYMARQCKQWLMTSTAA